MTVNSIEVNCTIAGGGAHLLFLHGWGVGHEVYRPLLEHLQKSFKVFALDLPGFGGTPEPPRPWGVEEYVEFTLEFMRAAGVENAFMLGHSNGGRILLNMLGGGRANAAKLVLFGSAGLKARHGTAWYAKVYSYKTAKLALSPFPKLRERFAQGRGSDDYRRASPLMRATMSRLIASDATPLLESISAPTLLVWGEDDTAAPLSDAKIMEKRIPDAGLAVFPGGHWAFMEQLPRTLAVLDVFLK